MIKASNNQDLGMEWNGIVLLSDCGKTKNLKITYVAEKETSCCCCCCCVCVPVLEL